MLPDSFTPDFLRQLELVKIRSRRAFLGTRQGGHVSPKRGHGIEFADYRKYELGDNPRHIDWGVYGRSDRLYVKKYQEEQDLNVYIIIDTSASMFVPALDRKWQAATEIAMALAYVALMEQDSVTVLAPGYLSSPIFYGGRAIHQLGTALLGLEVTGGREFTRLSRQALARVRFPGVAIVISDFLMPQEELRFFFNQLRALNMDITAIQLLGANDLDPLPGLEAVRAVDSETGEEVQLGLDAATRADYAALLEEHNNRLQEFLASSRISYIMTPAEYPIAEFVTVSLPKVGLLR